MSTESEKYTRRLVELESVWWKKLFDVQRPYRLHLQSLKPGFVLDIGCGIGRNLLHLGGHDAGIGVDINPFSVQVARQRNIQAFTPEEFATSDFSRQQIFDSILLSHVAEHMTPDEVAALLAGYLPFLRTAGRVIVITPQEKGFASDSTHVSFTDFTVLQMIALKSGLTVTREYSFPLPRSFGRVFPYNEFVSIMMKGPQPT